MLGKTAGGLYWMFRYLERSENTARLVEAGFRMALTRPKGGQEEWASVVSTAGGSEALAQRYEQPDAANVTDFLLRDRSNPASVFSVFEGARNNARLVRTALTREVWTSVNDGWLVLNRILARPVPQTELPEVLGVIRQQSALVRGALHGTMLRNDIFNFARIGTFIERADNTSRILDVKYHLLLPSVSLVGSPLDQQQWEMILRSASAERALGWLNEGDLSPVRIANFLIFDQRMPRSLAYCYYNLKANLDYLAQDYSARHECHDAVQIVFEGLRNGSIESVFDSGLHEFIQDFILSNNRVGASIERDYQFWSPRKCS